ncbi:probable G-protein coupled receptor 139 isoform X1 [Narcine bancroftii]|uniref:probable G-protein coupled receptor 139 isoform X1 n=2 Tax=Narcine bancroftii TaxID=1343680 RepID=UPI0038311264
MFTDMYIGTVDQNDPTTRKNIFWAFEVFLKWDERPLHWRIYFLVRAIQVIYYPILAMTALPVISVTIKILSRGNCGLSKNVTLYLLAMAAADLLIVIFDLIMRQIPIAYRYYFRFLKSIPLCNIHAVLVYTVTDWSVWNTVAFTFDRFVAICYQKMKRNYCTEKTATFVLGTVSVLSFSKNIFWYFMFTGEYFTDNTPWFCLTREGVRTSENWATATFVHHIFTPAIPFVLILLLNGLTVRHILVTSRVRRRLRGASSRESFRDPEMESRRKSVTLLYAISANFILLWSLFTGYFIWVQLYYVRVVFVSPAIFVQDLGFMLQLLSCCTNTALYTITQKKLREQLKELVKSSISRVVKCAQ